MKIQLLALFLYTAFSIHALADDPFQNIESFKLQNGVSVIFGHAPNLKNNRISLEVDVGYGDETTANAGVSHLLEHYLFTSKKLKKNVTYLDLVKDRKGTANGVTSYYQTEYWMTLPIAETNWAVETLFEMIHPESFDPIILDEQREPVLLEINHPKTYDYFKEYLVQPIMNPKFLRKPSFNETEFAYSDELYTREWERINTLKLSSQDLTRHFAENYHPGNYQIKILGTFNAKEIKVLLEKTFGRLPKVNKGYEPKTRTYAKPRPIERPWWKVVPAQGSPYIQIGFKFWDMNIEDEIIMKMYLEFASKQLQKILRNERTQTYSVRWSLDPGYLKFGSGWLELESSEANFWDNFKLVEGRVDNDILSEKLSKSEFDEMKDDYLNQFDKMDMTLGTLTRLAHGKEYSEKFFNETASPYAFAKAITFEKFKERAKTLFSKERRAYQLSQAVPGEAFRKFLHLMLGLIFSMALGKKMYKRPFDHRSLRWMRKLSSPPVFLQQVTVASVTFLFCEWIWAALEWVIEWNQIGKTNLWTSELIPNQLEIIWILIMTITAFCFTPRKLMIVGDKILIKSLSFRYSSIPLKEIDHIELIKPKNIYLSPKRLSKLGYFRRFYGMSYANPFKHGIWCELKDGTSYFFPFSKAKNVYSELKGIHEEYNSSGKVEFFKLKDVV